MEDEEEVNERMIFLICISHRLHFIYPVDLSFLINQPVRSINEHELGETEVYLCKLKLD